MKKYIRCDNCGKKIYRGDNVYFTPGLIYSCCSSGCLARLTMNVRYRMLDDAYIENEGLEWDEE